MIIEQPTKQSIAAVQAAYQQVQQDRQMNNIAAFATIAGIIIFAPGAYKLAVLPAYFFFAFASPWSHASGM